MKNRFWYFLGIISALAMLGVAIWQFPVVGQGAVPLITFGSVCAVIFSVAFAFDRR